MPPLGSQPPFQPPGMGPPPGGGGGGGGAHPTGPGPPHPGPGGGGGCPQSAGTGAMPGDALAVAALKPSPPAARPPATAMPAISFLAFMCKSLRDRVGRLRDTNSFSIFIVGASCAPPQHVLTIEAAAEFATSSPRGHEPRGPSSVTIRRPWCQRTPSSRRMDDVRHPQMGRASRSGVAAPPAAP